MGTMLYISGGVQCNILPMHPCIHFITEIVKACFRRLFVSDLPTTLSIISTLFLETNPMQPFQFYQSQRKDAY